MPACPRCGRNDKVYYWSDYDRPGATFYVTADLRADVLTLLALALARGGGDADGPHRPGRLVGLAAGSAYRAGYDGDAARYTRVRNDPGARFADLGALDAAAATHARDEPSSEPSAASLTASLDPTDWKSARAEAHKMLDISLDFIEKARDRPAWIPLPNEVRHRIMSEVLPEHGKSMTDVCQDIIDDVLPYSGGNTHPRFWGWVHGSGTVGGVIAEMMTAAMNSNVGLCSHSGVLIERQVIDWMKQLFQFPKTTAGGIIVSGTSMAAVVCLAVARYHALNKVRQDGLVTLGVQLVAYASTQTHVCVAKALELLGLGVQALRLVPVDEEYRMNIEALKIMIEEDRQQGFVPFCIVGNAGTVSTGAFDDLSALSIVARENNIWFHVDGAFGSFVVLDPSRRHLIDGLSEADSLAFDFHKWLHTPYAAGCVLLRQISMLNATFSSPRNYLVGTKRGFAGDTPWFCDMGIELSRPCRALKVWFTIKEHGIIRLGQSIAANCDQAQYLANLLSKYDFIQVLTPVSLNIVNFRVEPDALKNSDPETVDIFNDELVNDLQEKGIAVPSTTRLKDRLHIRVCVEIDPISDKLAKFQSDFWREEHHWYTEYSYNSTQSITYTIPFTSTIAMQRFFLLDVREEATLFEKCDNT
ncbi:unnamed protein product [Rotaria sordida]|uniref:Uncharacterized protein n=1 Tax=Rotaria sordida TaxID=392033 RepID=A0A815P3Q4_9BILA|nr:unnamed protein product [Rotaria sordida]CAF4058370.1 unnamed protein product [Rotaria sordida]